MIIAVDGPAGSGKSTIAKLIAKNSQLLYIDTGAMYRAVTYLYLKKKSETTEDEKLLAEILSDLHIKLEENKVFISNTEFKDLDISSEIRTSEISNNVSHIAAFKAVREKLVEEQRLIAQNPPRSVKGVILDGRDIGTVVFPNADHKIFLTASAEIRAKRRLKDLEKLGEKPDLDTLINEVKERDRKDSERKESPLKKADNAIELNTDAMDIQQVVEKIQAILSSK